MNDYFKNKTMFLINFTLRLLQIHCIYVQKIEAENVIQILIRKFGV